MLADKKKRNDYAREYYRTHSARQKIASKKWRDAHPNKSKEYRDKEEAKEYQKKWRENNRDKLKTYWDTSNNKIRTARARHKLAQSSGHGYQESSSPEA